MADLAAIRTALAAALATITGLRAFAYIPDSVPVPAAVVGAPSIAFDKTYGRGLDIIRVPIRVYVCRTSDRLAQARLDAYFETGVGTTRITDDQGVYLVGDDGAFLAADITAASLKAAIETDRTLGGVAHSTRVTSAEGFGTYTIGGLDVLGAEWQVEVVVRGGA